MANTAFGTSIFSLGQEEHKLEIARAINPGLCLITEDLVFTEPYFENGRNSVLPTNEKDAQELANDKEMVHEIGLLKYKFMTAGESLIHGDLHTGSVMIKCEDKKVAVSVKAIDSEFSFYGPIGFDLGALVANYTIAAARACALGNIEQMHWALSLAEQTWVEFEKERKKYGFLSDSAEKVWHEFMACIQASIKENSNQFRETQEQIVAIQRFKERTF